MSEAILGGGARQVQIGQSAVGNVIITGDGNTVHMTVHLQQHAVVDEQPATASQPIGANPYRGLAAFQEQDCHVFFGREALTSKLWGLFCELNHRQNERNPPPRLIPILGPSGSGKSSVVRAGLLPELVQRPLPGAGAIRTAVFTPGRDPLRELASMLALAIVSDPLERPRAIRVFGEELLAVDGGRHDGLARIATTLAKDGVAHLILVVDQFEEIYSLREKADRCGDGGAARDAFVANLLHAAEACGPVRVHVVLTMRSDFLGETQHFHPELNRAIAERPVLMPAMSKEELRQVIAEPARRAGHPLENGTVRLLVAQTWGKPGALPLLEFALTRIWEAMRRGQDAAAALEEIGGVGGALAGQARDIYDKLDAGQKAVARRVFLELVQFGEGHWTEDRGEAGETRRRRALSELVAKGEAPDVVREVLRQFSHPGARLVTLAADESANLLAEVTHEALFQHWDDLRGWIERGKEELRLHRRVDGAAAQWIELGQPAGSLWRPPELDLLRAHVRRGERGETDLRLNDRQAAFHRASEERQQAEEARERKRQEEERDRLLRARKRSRVLAGVFAGVAVVLAILGGAAWRLAQKEKAERTRSLARALAARARMLADRPSTHLQTAALLAVESVRLEPTLENDEILRLILGRMLRPVAELSVKRGDGDMAISPDGRHVALQHRAGSNHKVIVAELPTLRVLAQIEVGADFIGGTPVFSPTGRYLVINDLNPWLLEWAGSLRARLGRVRNVRFTRGDDLLVGSSGAGILVYEARTAKLLHEISSSAWIDAIAVDTESDATVAVGFDGSDTIELVDARRGGPRLPFRVAPLERSDNPDAALAAADGAVSPPSSGEIRLLEFVKGHRLIVNRETETSVWLIDEALKRPPKRIAAGRHEETWSSKLVDAGSAIIANSSMRGGTGIRISENGTDLARVACDPDCNAYDAKGPFVMTAPRGDTARVWNWKTGEEMGRALHDTEVWGVAISIEAGVIVSAGNDGVVRTWELPSDNNKGRRTFPGPIDAVVSSQGGRYIAVESGARDFTLWEPLAGRDVHTDVLRGFVATALSADASRFAVMKPHSVDVFKINESRPELSIPVPSVSVEYRVDHAVWRGLKMQRADALRLFDAVEFTEDVPLRTISGEPGAGASPGLDTSLARETHLFHDYKGPSPSSRFFTTIAQILVGTRDTVALSNDGSILALSMLDYVWVFDVPSGTRKHRFALGYTEETTTGAATPRKKLDLAKVERLWFSPDGSSLMATTEELVLRWDLGSPNAPPLRLGDARSVMQIDAAHGLLACKEPGKLLIRRWDWSIVRSWDVADERPLVFSPDGKAIATVETAPVAAGTSGGNLASRADIVHTRLSASGRPSRSFPIGATVTAAQFDAAGEKLAVASSDQVVRVWDLSTGREVLRVSHGSVVSILAFAADGSTLYISTGRGPDTVLPAFAPVIHKLPLATAALVNEICARSVRNLSREEWNDNIGDGPHRETCVGRPLPR
ncbi:nSTAND1 domain-containing NTPase [Sorangium sp. So ce861]|uniref:nSTAND1 domain-containing NTPase n=1 Tax=Sorangium sp. So ce861 TaxID=3133323 RepID=UPI003F5EAE5F